MQYLAFHGNCCTKQVFVTATGERVPLLLIGSGFRVKLSPFMLDRQKWLFGEENNPVPKTKFSQHITQARYNDYSLSNNTT